MIFLTFRRYFLVFTNETSVKIYIVATYFIFLLPVDISQWCRPYRIARSAVARPPVRISFPGR